MPPININIAEMEMVESIKFLEINFTNILSWTKHIELQPKKPYTMLLLPQVTEEIQHDSNNSYQFQQMTVESILVLHHSLVWEQL